MPFVTKEARGLADLPVQPPLLNFPAHNGPGHGFFGLKPGETFSAQVVGKTSAGLTVLAFGGRQVPVTLPNPPPVGSTLTLQIHQTPQGMQLVLIDTQLPAAQPSPAQPSTPATQITLGQAGIAHQAPSPGPASSGANLAQSQAAPGQAGASPHNPASAVTSAGVAAAGPVLAQTVVAALASQNSAAALFANLFKLGEKTRDFPQPVRETMAKLLRVPLDGDEPITAKTLKQAIERSGIFLESNLAAQTPKTAPLDLKALLMSLRLSLGEWLQRPASPQTGPAPRPPERGHKPSATPLRAAGHTGSPPAREAAQQLLSQTEAALSRLRLLQIASLPDHAHPDKAPSVAHRSEWQMEIPMLFGSQAGTLNLQIQRDGHNGSQGAEPERWQVHLSLEAGALGPISADVQLSAKRVNATLWAERLEVAQLLHNELEGLAGDLKKVGLEPGHLHVRRPAKEATNPAPAGHILDLGT